jgi:Transcriptional regulatory protein, C terminal
MEDPRVRFRILGPIEAARAGTTLDLGGPRHRKLLAVLLVHAGEVVSTERLIQALWGDEPPEGAAAALHVRVSELRKALRGAQPGADAGLLTRGSGYLLQVGATTFWWRCRWSRRRSVPHGQPIGEMAKVTATAQGGAPCDALPARHSSLPLRC